MSADDFSIAAMGEASPMLIEDLRTTEQGSPAPMDGVGAVLHCAISEEELDAHIADLCVVMRRDHAHFRDTGDVYHLAQARKWWEAIKAATSLRDELYGAKRHQAFEDRISAGVDYFQSPYALELGRSGRA